MAEKSNLQKLQESSTQDVMAVIYAKINELFGAGNQLFAMEFPARSLNGKDYEYDTSDCYSTLTKPYPVQEAEFALSNALYDVSPIVQGPNGEKLSTVYSTALNNYVPKLQALDGFVNDQKNLRKWLLTQVHDEVNGQEKTISRIALSKELYAQFLEQRNEWYKKKNDRYDDLKKKNDLDGYARWLSTEGLVEEEKINNMYNDAVVRGNYHEVLTLLGFLNVSSPAEILEDTKQKMRASLRRSLDGSSDVYPVQFQPSDWFRALRPNMSPKDLTMATESLMADYKAKKSRLSSLQAQLAELGVIEISVGQQRELETKIGNCEKQLADAEQKLIDSYGKGTVEAVKAAINIYKAVDPSIKAADVAKNLSDPAKTSSSKSKVLDIIGTVAEDVMKSIADTYDKQANIIRQHKELTDTKMAYAEAKVKDKRIQRLRIEEQIRKVQDDVDFLHPLVMGVIAEDEKKVRAEAAKSQKGTPDEEKKDGEKTALPSEEPLMTESSEDTEDSNFMDVIIKCDESGSFSTNKSSASAEDRSWGVGGWFWSGHAQSSQSDAMSEEDKKSINQKIEIGFRAKKVSFERGGWFNPNVFKLSNNYFRLADIRCSGGMSKDQVLTATGSEALRTLKTYRLPGDNKDTEYVLPAFPTGFVIAKDITIRIATNSEDSSSTKKYMQSNESGGGFFCFRGNRSKSSSSNSETAYFGSTDKFFYIRIPGPQILGWFLEFTGADNSTPYERLNADMYADTLKSLVKPDENKTLSEQQVKTQE